MIAPPELQSQFHPDQMQRDTHGHCDQVLTAMVTPFNQDGSLNYGGAEQLANYLIDNGSDGLVLAGTTGESPTLTPSEQLELFDVVRHAVGPEVTLIGGTGSNNTEEGVNMSIEAGRRQSIDGLLVVSPYYNRPSQYGIQEYYAAIARSTNLPVTLYNIPVRTGRAVDYETVGKLFEKGHIAAVKDATGSTDMAAKLIAEYGSELPIYSGDDGKNLEFARIGAIGAISVASHWAGKETSALFTAFRDGDHERAERIAKALAPSCDFESSHVDAEGTVHDTPNPIPTKVMMGHLLGTEVIGTCRPPMLASPHEMRYLAQRAPEVLAELQTAMQQIDA